jgi:hypothetical protein
MLAAILMKPALALVLVVGVNMLSGPTGVGGLLAGAGVLLISLFCPLVLFRLLAFVEHGARYTSASRAAPVGAAGMPLGAFGDAYSEQVNTARFDGAAHGAAPAWRGPGTDGPAGVRSSGVALAATARSVRDRAEPAADGTGVGPASSGSGGSVGDSGSGPPQPTRLGDAPPGTGHPPVGHRPRPPRIGSGSARGAPGGGSEPRAREATPRTAHPARRPVNGTVRPAGPGGAVPKVGPPPAVRRRSDDNDVTGGPR